MQDAMKSFGKALIDYARGNTSAEIILEREDSLKESLPMAVFFRTPSEFTLLENAALDLCMGRVLDIGAGAGIHTLELQNRGFKVSAMDISPDAVSVMSMRGVREALCADIFHFQCEPYDTLLLLGHGIGMAGDLKGVDDFLSGIKKHLKSNGQILLHSLDVTKTEDPRHLDYHEMNVKAYRYIGEIRLRIRYQRHLGPLYSWIQLDPETLQAHAKDAGWRTEVIVQEKGGDYLARLTLME